MLRDPLSRRNELPRDSPRQPPKLRNLRRIKRRSVLPEQVVEPDLRLLATFLRPPREDRVRLSRNQSPVNRRHPSFLEQSQMSQNSRIVRPSHPLRANHRPPQSLQRGNLTRKRSRVVIVMKRHHIAALQLDLVQSLVAIPNPNRQRLQRSNLLGPVKNRIQQWNRLQVITRVSRLVIKVPKVNPLILAESPKDVLHIDLQPRKFRLRPSRIPRRPNPPAVMNPLLRRWLSSNRGIRIPAIIEENKQRPNLVLRSNLQKRRHPLLKSFRVSLISQIMEINPNRVHPNPFRPSQLPINRPRIPTLRLPHLQLVDRSRRQKVSPDNPRLLRLPLVSLFSCPLNTRKNCSCYHPTHQHDDSSIPHFYRA